MQERLEVGLAITQKENNLTEMRKFLLGTTAVVILFPEGYLPSEKLEEACRLARDNKKWIVSGMEDRREAGKFYEAAVVINPKGKVVGEHRKTSLTKYEIEQNYSKGNSIKVIQTDFGKIGIVICYEIHLPEVARVLALQGAEIIFNPVGTGMGHEEQYGVWTRMVATRAYENGVFVVGCSHYNDTIPLAFACDPKGNFLLQERSVNRLIPVILDASKYTIGRNFNQRRPDLYETLVKRQNE